MRWFSYLYLAFNRAFRAAISIMSSSWYVYPIIVNLSWAPHVSRRRVFCSTCIMSDPQKCEGKYAFHAWAGACCSHTIHWYVCKNMEWFSHLFLIWLPACLLLNFKLRYLFPPVVCVVHFPDSDTTPNDLWSISQVHHHEKLWWVKSSLMLIWYPKWTCLYFHHISSHKVASKKRRREDLGSCILSLLLYENESNMIK